MSVNYFNSAGTDLDNLFYTNNGNAGAVGFIEASGQDLGNRYTNASTLGYAVGLVNSAGTDLGYLRGSAVPPGVNSYWANIGQLYVNKNYYVDNFKGDEDDEDDRNYIDTDHYRRVSAYINAGITGRGTGDLTYQLCAAAISGAKALTVSFALWDNDTAKHEDFKSPTVIARGFTLNANSESTWLTSFTGSCNTTPSRNFSIQMTGSYSDRLTESTSVPLGIRIYQRIYSSVGDSGWVHTDIWFS